MIDLLDRMLAIHHALADADLAHAFGGALALAYCTPEPRATRDIDINIFAPPESVDRVLDALPADVTWSERDVTLLQRDGQARLWWGDTPVDVFLSNHEFHDHVAQRIRIKPLAGQPVPFVSGTDLVVFKAFFNRPKDWIDIGEIAAYADADFAEARRWLSRLIGDDDERVERLDETVAAAALASYAPEPAFPSLPAVHNTPERHPPPVCGAPTRAGQVSP